MSQKGIRTYDAGEIIFRKGDAGHEMYVVLEGKASIAIAENQHVSIGTGEFFGEMAVIDARPRSATVTALESGTRLLSVDEAKFIYLMNQQPAFALAVMGTMSQRLRGTPSLIEPPSGPVDAQYVAKEIKPGLWHLRSRSRAGNAYLVVGHHRKTLVDTGLATTYPSLEKALDEIGHPPSTIDLVVLTHEHADHVGGAALLSGTQTIAAHPLAANKIALKDDFATVSGVIGENIGDFRVDLCLTEGSVIDVAPFRFEVIHTPGHTSGCICLLEIGGGAVICGDALMAGGALGGIFGSGNISDYILSLQKLQKLKLNLMLPGHGRISQEPDADIAIGLEKAHSLLQETRELFRAFRGNEAFDRILASTKNLNR